jgi:hypothetical protein
MMTLCLGVAGIFFASRRLGVLGTGIAFSSWCTSIAALVGLKCALILAADTAMRFSGAPSLAGVVVRVDERVFLGVGVLVVTNGFSFSSVSFRTTRLLAGGEVSRVRVRFPRSVVIAAADLGGNLVSLESAVVVLVILAVCGVAMWFWEVVHA